MAGKRKTTAEASGSSAPKRARRTTATSTTTVNKRKGWPKTDAERELYGFTDPVEYGSDVDEDTPELVHSRRYDGKKTYKTRMAEGLPPLHDLDEMFRLIVIRALELGLDTVLDHLGDRPLRVATVCSGTESPLLALEMVKSNLEKHFGRTLPFLHLFSAEIVPFKQAYIERNFHPRHLFRDVNELKDRVAKTAYGALEKVPKNVDLLVAGFSCVDFSGLNNNRKKLDEQGESGGTFWAIVRHARVYRPRVMVLENVKLAPWEKIVGYLDEIDYLGIHVAVDTKAFYLPQTRERGYMLCLDKKLMQSRGITEEQARAWPALVQQFRRPASSPIGMFTLGPDNKRLEQIERELALRLATSKRSHTSWDKYRLRHHYYRVGNDLGHKRPVTRFQENGARQMHDFAWKGFFSALPERVLDTIDCNFLRKLVGGYDMNFKERCLELSQGIDRDTDSRAYGIVGCITPSGIPYLTTRGGPLAGMEALSLQGLPVKNLILTRESQRDLQDLAGNAMSSTVVCSAMLAALIIAQTVLQKGEHLTAPKGKASPTKTVTIKGGIPLTPATANALSLEPFDACTILDEANLSARYCVCERQSQVLHNIVKCTMCGHTACTTCAGNPDHVYERLEGGMRIIPSDFVMRLRGILPNRLTVAGISAESYSGLRTSVDCPSTIWDDFLAAMMRAVDDELRFSDISRGTVWTVSYEGKQSTLNLVISPTRGLEWRLFAKALESEPSLSVNREILSKPVARMAVTSNSLLEGTWQVCAPLSSRLTLLFEAAGEKVSSFEARCGLQGEGVPLSKVWSQVVVRGSDTDASSLEVDVRGTYQLLPECGTACASLHKKEASEGKPAVYLFLDPTKLGEPKYDSFVFSLEHDRIASYAPRLTIAEVAHSWRPSRQSEVHQELVHIYYRKWANADAISLRPYMSDAPITFYNLEPKRIFSIDHTACSGENITLLSLSAPVGTIGSFGDVSCEVINPLDSPAELGNLAWLLLRASAATGYEDWGQVIETQAEDSYGFDGCTTCTPPKPAMIWSCNAKGVIKACEDPRDAALYERQLKSKPSPFLVFRHVDEHGLGHLKITVNIQTLLHQAYDKLAASRTIRDALFLWRLIPNAHDARNLAFSSFELHSNSADPQSPQPPNFKITLRPEQLRSLHWMIEQEGDDVKPFTEEEVEEALLPQLMWRAEAKVSAPRTVRGGLLADEVGYGKTAIILGLIDAQSGQGGPPRPAPTKGTIPCKATLILTPRTLFKQWQLEIRKFTGSTYKVIAISESSGLENISIRQIREADIVLVTWEVFGDQEYYRTMQMFTGMPRVPEPVGRNFVDWFSEAHQSLEEQVDTLMNQGPSSFLDSLPNRRSRFRNTAANYTYTPSQRLRGKHYAEANADQPRDAGIDVEYAALSSADEESDSDEEKDPGALRTKAARLVQLQPLRTFAPPKKKKKDETTTEEQDKPDDAPVEAPAEHETEKEAVQAEPDRDDTEYEDIDGPPSQKRANPNQKGVGTKRKAAKTAKKGKGKAKPERLFWSDRQAFGIEKRTKTENWETMKNVPIHAFSFERLVIDEFTYLNLEPKPIAALQAHTRWVLSGTPPLNNFADVNTIAPLLGVHLGVDDDDMKSHNKLGKQKQKIQSDAEVFQTYRAPRSEVWHRNRHELAQRFLDQFARKNVPHIDEIPFTEHFCLVSLSPAENTIYLELYKQLLGVNAQTFRGSRSKFGSDLEKRMDEIIRGSNTAEEALLKRCTTLALSHQWRNGKPEATTCKSLIETRRKHIAAAKDIFAMEVKLAIWLMGQAEEDVPLFEKFTQNMGKHEFGDDVLTIEARAVIDGALLEKTDDDWKLFFEDPEEVERAKAAAAAEKEANQGKTKKKKKKKKSQKEEEPPNLPKLPAKKEIHALLRRTVSNMRSYLAEWVTRARALRFLEAMDRVQQNSEITCDRCHDRILKDDEIRILGSCGHTFCPGCSRNFDDNEECAAERCHARAKKTNIFSGEAVGRNENDTISEYGGTKMGKLIDIIENIPGDEKALLFIQYEEIMKVASKALDLAKIKHTVIYEDKKSRGRLDKYLAGGFGKIRVLVLMLGSEMAAGLNLQFANHVIFLSPLLAESQYDYESTMTQAAGRARRYGQTRHVHVYHVLARQTVDVDVFQYRRASVLLAGVGGEATLVKADSPLGTGEIRGQGPSLGDRLA